MTTPDPDYTPDPYGLDAPNYTERHRVTERPLATGGTLVTIGSPTVPPVEVDELLEREKRERFFECRGG